MRFYGASIAWGIWHVHVNRLSIFAFCISFCIFLHRGLFGFVRPWAFRTHSIYGSAHAFQSLLGYHGSKEASHNIKGQAASGLALMIICCPQPGISHFCCD